jgi:anaerobic dimethyl sulfoxide reductase subunit A
LSEWWETKVRHHHHIEMPWEEFKARGVYKFILPRPYVAYQDNVEKGVPWNTPSGKVEIFSTQLATTPDFRRTHMGTIFHPFLSGLNRLNG